MGRATRNWLQAIRLLALPNTLLPALFGVMLAVDAGAEPAAIELTICFLMVACLHAAIVFLNDYADRQADAVNDAPTWLSGGSRVLVEGRLYPERLLQAGLACGTGVVVLGIAASLRDGIPSAALLAFGAVFLLWLYSFQPVHLNYRGGGELLQAIGCGMVLPLLGFALVGGTSADGPLTTPALPRYALMQLAAALAIVLPDLEADTRAGKMTFAVRAGLRPPALAAALAVVVALLLPAAWHWAASMILAVQGLLILSAASLLGKLARQRVRTLFVVLVSTIPMLELFAAWMSNHQAPPSL